MNATQSFIIEASRINSTRVEAEGEEADNKNSWVNKIKPILLRKGDTVSLNNCLINIRGADSNSIEFTGGLTTPTSTVVDNKTQLTIGFYINHNGDNEVGMPFVYKLHSDTSNQSVYKSDQDLVNNPGAGQRQNNSLGEALDYDYFSGNLRANSPFDFGGVNPNQYVDGTKYAKIDVAYKGWVRDSNGIRPTDNPKASLMTTTLDLNVSPGFLDPNSLADTLTIQMAKTLPPESRNEDDATLFLPVANNHTADPFYPMSMYHFNGICMKTVPANFQSPTYNGTAIHRVYGNIATQEPYKWLYGNHILTDATTFNCKGDPRFDTTQQNYQEFQANYPVCLWSIYDGQGNTDDLGNYSFYSPSSTSIGENGDYSLITVSGFTSTNNMDNYNDVFHGTITKGTTTGLSLQYKSANNQYVISNNYNTQSDVANPNLYIDNDLPNATQLIAFNRFHQFNGQWEQNNNNAITYTMTDINDTSASSKDNWKAYTIQKNLSFEEEGITLANNSYPNQGGNVGVNFNRNYTIKTRGFIANYVGGTGFVATNTLTGHSSNVSMLIDDSDPTYTYWCFQQTGVNNFDWYVYRLTKYAGGTITNGTVLGDYASNGLTLKQPTTVGQRYLDLSTPSPFTKNGTTPEWNYGDGNDWEAPPPPSTSTETYSFTTYYGQNLTRPNGYAYNMTYQRVLPSAGAVVYLYADPSLTTATNGGGTAQYDTGGASIWTGSWTFVNNGGTQNYGAITLTASWGTEVFNSMNTITKSNPPFNITNHIVSNVPTGLPGIPSNTNLKYFASFPYNGHTLYMLYNTGVNEDLNGLTGIAYGGVNQTDTYSWTNSGNEIVFIGASGFTITKQGVGSIVLSSVPQYSTSQTLEIGGLFYDIPINGENYPTTTFTTYGSTSRYSATTPTYYLSVLDKNVNIILNQGNIHTSLGTDTSVGTWLYSTNATYYTIAFSFTNGTPNFTVQRNKASSPIINYGWLIMRCNKTTSFNDGNNLTPQEQFYLTDNMNTNAGLNGLTGLPDGSLTVNNQTGTFTNEYNKNFFNFYARLPQSQMIITNIKYTEDNVKLIENYYRKTEVYSGSFTVRSDIQTDLENFYATFDLGRTSDLSNDIHTGTGWGGNATGDTPIIPIYMRDKTIMGRDSGNNDSANRGNTYPTYRTPSLHEQRIRVFTRFKDDYYDRLKYTNMVRTLQDGEDFRGCYGVSYDEGNLGEAPGFQYAKDNNVGVYPVQLSPQSGDPNVYVMAFEVYQDYINDELYKIQNHTYFGFSPSFLDHSYVACMNCDACARDMNNPPSYARKTNPNEYANWINIGAESPTLAYANSVNRFQFSYLHTKKRLNAYLGAEADVGKEVARGYTTDHYINDWIQPAKQTGITDIGTSMTRVFVDSAPGRNYNIGLVDSLSGIYIDDFKLYDESNQLVDVNETNYYGCLWWKCGFSYYDFLPMVFNDTPFRNRFSNLFYNTLKIGDRERQVRPFTTNSGLDIGAMSEANLFTQNSIDGGDTKNQFQGEPQYLLGFNNHEAFSLEVESAFMNAKSIPVFITSAYYRIMTDIPCDTMEYNAQSSAMSCIGYALKNYSSSSYYFSYAMDFGATITRPYLLSNIKTELRNDRGQLVSGIDDKSSVVYKITRQIPLSAPEPDPELEILKDIKGELSENNKLLSQNNTLEEVENNRNNTVSEPETPGEPLFMDTDVSEFMRNFENSVIRTLINSIKIPEKIMRGQGNIANNRDVIRMISTAVARYYKVNGARIQELYNALEREGVEKVLSNPRVRQMVSELKDFSINTRGALVKGGEDTRDEIGRFSIDRGGAELIADALNRINLNRNPTVGAINNAILPTIQNLYDTNTINANIQLPTSMERRLIKESVLRRPLDDALEEEIGGKDPNFKRILTNLPRKRIRTINQVYTEMKKAVREGDTNGAYIYQRALVSYLRDAGITTTSDLFLRPSGRRPGTGKRETREEGRRNIRRMEEARGRLSPPRTPRGFDPRQSQFGEVETKERSGGSKEGGGK